MSEITLSGLAGLFLYEYLDAEKIAPPGTMRLRRDNDDYCLEVDEARPDDCVAVFRNRVVLAVERALSESLGPCRVGADMVGDAVSVYLTGATETRGATVESVIWQSTLS